MANFFVIGIGGTGMRCIESLVHLCAMGMFDNTTIHLLALDTDRSNGNFARLRDLVGYYKTIKGEMGAATSGSYFSANIKYYQFCPEYDDNHKCFEDIFNYRLVRHEDSRKTQLADLFFTKDVETLDLEKGYRAQTHLGSLMMYRSIVDAADHEPDNEEPGIRAFVNALIDNLGHQTKPKVFVLGSVFGGTGASSIPIIPRALQEVAYKISPAKPRLSGNVYYSSTLLTAYFSFTLPTRQELAEEHIIATADKFTLNSKAAMFFYNRDKTVGKDFQRFYMLGTPDLEWKPMKKETDRTAVGGSAQTNDSHYIELMAACAAYDFYKTEPAQLEKLANEDNMNTNGKYVYRRVHVPLQFSDFVGADYSENFQRKFGTLVAFSFYCNGKDDIMLHQFEELNSVQVEGLKKYFEFFHIKFSPDGEVVDGWLRQLNRSTLSKSTDGFLFSNGLYQVENRKDWCDYKWNRLYKEEVHQFSTNIFSTKINKFVTELRTQKQKLGGQEISFENALQLVYNTLGQIYKF